MNIEKHNNLWFKRDDKIKIGDMYGAKVRACYHLGQIAKRLGYTTLTTVGAKSSPQINILATVGNLLDMKVVGHTTTAELQEDMLQAIEKGAEVLQHKPGYTSVLISEMNKYASRNEGTFIIPFGMDHEISINATKEDFLIIDREFLNSINRIVIPVGSGINCIGILKALNEMNITHIKVIGIKIGANPDKIFKKHLSSNEIANLEMHDALQDYNKHSEFTKVNGVEVDSTYEGKCIPFLKENDLFWIVGKKLHQKAGKEVTI